MAQGKRIVALATQNRIEAGAADDTIPTLVGTLDHEDVIPPLAPEGVVAGTANHAIVTLGARHPVVTRPGIDKRYIDQLHRGKVQGIAAGSTRYRIVAQATVYQLDAVCGQRVAQGKRIVTLATQNRIEARTANDAIPALVGTLDHEDVIPAFAPEGVVAGTADHQVVSL